MLVKLSWPPSTNQLWRAFKGRNILSAAARDWHKAASLELMAQRARPVRGEITVTISLCSPFKRPFDPDNRIKAIFDLLVKNALIDSDSDKTIKSFTVRCGSEPGAVIEVLPFERESG